MRNKDSAAGGIPFVIGLTVFIAVFQLKGGLGDHFEMISMVCLRSIAACMVVALAMLATHLQGWPKLWQPVLPLSWWAWWPFVESLGMTTPRFLVDRGADPRFEWWAAGWFFWTGLLIAGLLATGLYWRRWQRAW